MDNGRVQHPITPNSQQVRTAGTLKAISEMRGKDEKKKKEEEYSIALNFGEMSFNCETFAVKLPAATSAQRRAEGRADHRDYWWGASQPFGCMATLHLHGFESYP